MLTTALHSGDNVPTPVTDAIKLVVDPESTTAPDAAPLLYAKTAENEVELKPAASTMNGWLFSNCPMVDVRFCTVKTLPGTKLFVPVNVTMLPVIENCVIVAAVGPKMLPVFKLTGDAVDKCP